MTVAVQATKYPAVAPQPLPAALPFPDELPQHRQLRGRDRWMDWQLASIRQTDGFDPRTGEQLHRTTEVVAAPYPEYRAVVRLDKSTAFTDVIGAARALAMDGDQSRLYGNPQAVLQSESGSWYIATAGYWESPDHIEPLGVYWAKNDAQIKPSQQDIAAIVGVRDWVNFTDNALE